MTEMLALLIRNAAGDFYDWRKSRKPFIAVGQSLTTADIPCDVADNIFTSA